MFYASIVYYRNLDITWEVWNMRLCENILIMVRVEKILLKPWLCINWGALTFQACLLKKDTGALLNSLRCVRNAFDERSDLLVCIFEIPSQSLNWKKAGTIFIYLKILAPKHNLVQMLKNIAHCTLTSSEYFWFFLYNAPFWDNSFFESPIFWLGKKGK